MSSICIHSFASRIQDIASRAKLARERRDLDAELAAHSEMSALMEDHEMVQILATAYLLTEGIAFDQVSANKLSGHARCA